MSSLTGTPKHTNCPWDLLSPFLSCETRICESTPSSGINPTSLLLFTSRGMKPKSEKYYRQCVLLAEKVLSSIRISLTLYSMLIKAYCMIYRTTLSTSNNFILGFPPTSSIYINFAKKLPKLCRSIFRVKN